MLPNSTAYISRSASFSGILLADVEFDKGCHIDIFSGGDIYPDFLLEGIRRNILRKLVAQASIFGWIMTGPLPERNSKRLLNYVSGYAKIVVSRKSEGSLKPSGQAHKVLRNKSKSHCNGMDKCVRCLRDVKIGETRGYK